jgi:hypothetical protein
LPEKPVDDLLGTQPSFGQDATLRKAAPVADWRYYLLNLLGLIARIIFLQLCDLVTEFPSSFQFVGGG